MRHSYPANLPLTWIKIHCQGQHLQEEEAPYKLERREQMTKQLSAYYVKTDQPYGYDMYDSCVVVAKSKEEAVQIASKKCSPYDDGEEYSVAWTEGNTTCVELTIDMCDKIYNEGRYGNDKDKGVVVYSYNAG